jgi:homoserine trans-succinylase
MRDVAKVLDIQIPNNYFRTNEPHPRCLLSGARRTRRCCNTNWLKLIW